MNYRFMPSLGDPMGGTSAGNGRHPLKMREHAPPEAAPRTNMTLLSHSLEVMDSALRLYAHPDLLKVAAAFNGPDFTPFTESVWHKAAGLGAAVAWHQDGTTHWGDGWVSPKWDPGCHGFSFHVALSQCTPENTLWVVPGSHVQKADIVGLAKAGGDGDRLPDAVPCICKPGDVYMQNRNALHGSFPNRSPERRVTMQMGFHKRAAVLGVEANNIHNLKNGQTVNRVVYDEEWIHERSRVIQVAIDARRQKYPDETPFVYQPLVGEEDENRFDDRGRQEVIRDYWTRDIST